MGTVTFLSGQQVLGTIQVIENGSSSGTATLKRGFPPAVYSLTAQYNANKLFQASQSAPQQLTVTGTEPTITTVQATPDGSNYDFTVAVFGYGLAVPHPPTGMASLTEMSNGFNLGNISLPGSGMNTFLAAQSFGVGNLPRGGVAAGDFNGDGCPDLVVGNQNDNTVSVLLGNCNGTFQTQKTYKVDKVPEEIAVGDFNADGNLDLAVACHDSNAIDVLFGNGDGTFQAAVPYPTDTAVAVAVGDFNGDGLPDLASASASGTAGVLVNNGDGTFTQQQTFPAGSEPSAIAVGDFNGDGLLDLAVAASGSNEVAVLLGDGTGLFSSTNSYAVGNNPQAIATADFNGDGCLDLAVANYADSTVSVLLGHITSGQCDGTFSAQKTYPTGLGPQGIAVADFNGDGILDLAVTNSAGNTVGVLLGKGNGTFQTQVTYPVGSNPIQIAVADFLGDGVPDVAVANVLDNTVSVLLGGTVTAGQLLNVPVPGSGQQQVNATYTPNINYYSGSQGSVQVQGSSAVPTATTLTVSPSVASPGQVVTLTATVLSDNDPVTVGTVTFLNGKQVLGTVQVVNSGQSSGTATLKLGFPPGTYQLTAQYNGNNDFKASTSGPQPLTVNGTEPTITTVTATPDGGNWDFTVSVFGFGLAVPHPPTGTVSLVEMSNGFNLGNIVLSGADMNTFLPQQSYAAGKGTNYIAVADFNGDGIPDVVVTNANDDTVSVLLGKGDGTFQAQQTYPVGNNPYGVAVTDLNGDGIPDIAVANSQQTTVSVLLGKGDGTFQPQQTYAVGSEPVGVATADFNGDGIPDLAVTNELSGTVSVLLGKGDGTFLPQKTYAVGSKPFGIAVGDFNGDGVPDLAVTNYQDNTVGVLLGNGDGTFLPQQTYATGSNSQPTGIAVGDFNGDGIVDLAVAHFQDSKVSVLLGKGDGTFLPQQTYAVGSQSYGIAVGDFNGDGIADLAVTNENDSTVSVLLGNGNGTFQAQQTYAASSAPIGVTTADFLGNGVPGLAVANTSGNVGILLGGTVTGGQLKNVPVPGSGQQQVNATYTPNINYYAGSQGSVQVQGTLISTTTTLAVTANGKPVPPGGGAVSGETIVLNATVTPGTYGTLQAGGTVSFLDVDNTLATIPITISAGNGVASFSPNLGLGSHYLSANYSGDSNFGSSFNVFGNFTIVGPYSVSLTVSPLQATSSTVVTMTATVTYSQGSGGTVTFFDGTRALGTIQVEGGSGSSPGTATLKSKFPPGTHSLQAVFNGIGQIGGSMAQSTVQMLTVTGTEPSITTLTEQPDGSNFDFVATVFGFGFAPPTGLLNFNDLTNGFFIATVPLTGPGTSTFLPQQASLVGNEPLGVAVGDFNRDGFPDLVVTNTPDNTISVLLGNGDGTFRTQQIYQVGTEPPFVAVADFNGDGIADLAVTNFGDNTVGILLGKGDGTFQRQQTFPVGMGPVGVAVGDFNGDGVADVAVADENDNTVSVLLGKGDGTFGAAQTFQVGQAPYGLAIADFNRDGIADIVVANFVDNTVSVLLGKGDGTFQEQQAYPVGQNPYWVAVGDLNQDGIPDLAVANGTAGTVSVLLGAGDGSFQLQQAYLVGNTPTSIVISDFNGDGIPDLATANSSNNTISVLLGRGDGAFLPQQNYSTGPGPYAVAAADFNGDGVPDLAAPNAGDVTVSVLLGGTTIAAQLNDVPIIGSGQHMIQSNLRAGWRPPSMPPACRTP